MSSIFLIFYLFMIGAALGSFLNVVASRLPLCQSLMGRSHCSSCRKNINWYDLIPVFSFFILGGRCRNCKQPISIIHPLFEVLVGFLVLTWFYQTGWVLTVNSLLILIIILTALTLALSDYYYQIIPDEFLLAIVCLGLLLNSNHLIAYIVGSLVVTMLFWLIYYFSHGTAMGYGDVKYVFAIGLVLPLQWLALAIYLAFLTGGIVSAILILTKKKKMKSTISFGPFLTFGFIVALCIII